MPHFLSNMAEHCKHNNKMSARGRKSMSTRKGSPKQFRGTTSPQSFSPGRSTPPASELNRQDVWPQTQNYSWPANTEIDLQFVGTYRCPAELQDSVLGQSPPKTGAVRSTAGSQQAPAPASLPRPPSSWTAADDEEITVVCSDITEESVGSILSTQLKMLLKVQG